MRKGILKMSQKERDRLRILSRVTSRRDDNQEGLRESRESLAQPVRSIGDLSWEVLIRGHF